jgi:hypothetical protein
MKNRDVIFWSVRGLLMQLWGELRNELSEKLTDRERANINGLIAEGGDIVFCVALGEEPQGTILICPKGTAESTYTITFPVAPNLNGDVLNVQVSALSPLQAKVSQALNAIRSVAPGQPIIINGLVPQEEEIVRGPDNEIQKIIRRPVVD